MGAAARPMSARSTRRFRPGIPATLFTAFFLPLLLFLGSWQLDRAAEKQALFDAFAAGGPAVAVGAESTGLEELRRYAPVEATGRYLAQQQFLLDNMVAGGQAGYRVWTPLLVGEERVLLVDRGWVPRDFGATQTPDVGVDTGSRTVTGLLDRLPRPGIELDTNMVGGWPKVVQFPTRDELAEALGRTVIPGVLLLDAAEPDGYLRDWRASDFGPERHLGYAFQWFALAVTLVILYLAWSFRKSD